MTDADREPMALGRWANAPLAYVIAEYTLPPVEASFEELRRRVNDLVVDRYPIYQGAFTHELRIENSNVETRQEPLHQWMTVDRLYGFSLAPSRLALHSTGYQQYPEFRSRLEALLNDYMTARQAPCRALAAALRYIDVLVPDADFARPQQFVIPELRAVDMPNDIRLTEHSVDIQFQRVQLRGRARHYGHITNPQVMLPPDLMPLPLAAPDVARRSLEHRNAGRSIAFLDIEALNPQPCEPGTTALLEMLDEPKRLTKAAFKHVTLPEAREHWRVRPARPPAA